LSSVLFLRACSRAELVGMCAKGIPCAPAVATPPIQFALRLLLQRCSDWTVLWFAHKVVSGSGPVRRLQGHLEHLGGHFSHPVWQLAVHEAQGFEAQT